MKKPGNKPYLPGLMIACVGVLVVILSNSVLSDWIILGFGVRTLNLVKNIGAWVTGGGVVLATVLSVPLVKAIMRRGQEQRQHSRVMEDYREEGDDPKAVRRRLEYLQEEMPWTRETVGKCLDQMDMVDLLQMKQERLIKDNDARYLKNTLAALDEVEHWICRNFRNIVNLCIVAAGLDGLDQAKVDRYLEGNARKLSDAQELLRASVDWINQYDADSIGKCDEITHLIATIRESLEGDQV